METHLQRDWGHRCQGATEGGRCKYPHTCIRGGARSRGQHTLSSRMQYLSANVSEAFSGRGRGPRTGQAMGLGPSSPGLSGVSTGCPRPHNLCPQDQTLLQTPRPWPFPPPDGSIFASLSPCGWSQGSGSHSFLTVPSPSSPPFHLSPSPIAVTSCLRRFPEPDKPAPLQATLLRGFPTRLLCGCPRRAATTSPALQHPLRPPLPAPASAGTPSHSHSFAASLSLLITTSRVSSPRLRWVSLTDAL